MNVSRLARAALGAALAAALPPAASSSGEARGATAVPWSSPSGFDGATHEVWSKKASANVVVFFRPGQERSLEALRELGRSQKDLAAKPVHFVAVASDSAAPGDVAAMLKQAGLSMPVVRDAGDALYGLLEIRLHPYVVILDGAGHVVARQPYLDIGFGDLVSARARWAMHEISDAELARAVDPPAAPTHTEAGVARRHVNFAKGLLRIGKPLDALAEVGKSLSLSPSAEAYALKGQILAEDGRCATALAAFDAALALEPTHAAARDGKERCGKVATAPPGTSGRGATSRP